MSIAVLGILSGPELSGMRAMPEEVRRLNRALTLPLVTFRESETLSSDTFFILFHLVILVDLYGMEL